MEEMWEDEYESDSGPPVMPNFTTVPDCPTSDEEGAIQFRVTLATLVHSQNLPQMLPNTSLSLCR